MPLPPIEALFHHTISRYLRHACGADAQAFCLNVFNGLHRIAICPLFVDNYIGFEAIGEANWVAENRWLSDLDGADMQRYEILSAQGCGGMK